MGGLLFLFEAIYLRNEPFKKLLKGSKKVWLKAIIGETGRVCVRKASVIHPARTTVFCSLSKTQQWPIVFIVTQRNDCCGSDCSALQLQLCKCY